MKSVGDRVGRQEKAKQGNLCDWIKIKGIDTHFFHIGGCGQFSEQLTINMMMTVGRFVLSALVQWLCFEGCRWGKRKLL